MKLTSNRFINTVLYLFLCIGSAASNVSDRSKNTGILESMKIYVSEDANRSVSFTNKQSGYYYTQTHQSNHIEYSWFEGLNISQNRIFSGYNLFAGNKLLNNQNSKVWVYPYKLIREHETNIKEELWMFDNKNIVEVDVTGAPQNIAIELKGENVKYIGTSENIVFFSSIEGNNIIAVSSKTNTPIQFSHHTVITSSKSRGFYISVDKSETAAKALIDELRRNNQKYKIERIYRMANFLLRNVYVKSNSDSLDLALNWLELNMDQLITNQRGEGIYAGLPWFNEYWGRDEFISLPGATLISGQYDTARKILMSFAKFQNTDSASVFFGRVPNIVKTSDIDYHTTDGTPRFIISLQEYVKYSGDTSIISQLYTTVRNSIEGALKNWTDAKGYLIHKDNETWMDARDKNLRSYSPRDNRANDIEALWYNQLCAGSYFANYMDDQKSKEKWTKIAKNIKQNFENDYRNSLHNYLADHLKSDDKADFTLRPNQLFAFDMLGDTAFKYKALQKVWTELVYPWGVATLDRNNIFFHSFHLSDNYPKDEAYHNGTIWPWLNGIAMQRMVESGQTETAYKLFKNMNRQVLTSGVVGGLTENMDAYPHHGQKWPIATGAYLQAWSIAEQLRVWYQCFLGIQPDMTANTLKIAPRIPDEIKYLEYNFCVGNQLIIANYKASDTKTYNYSFNQQRINAVIDIPPFETVSLTAEPYTDLSVQQTTNFLLISVTDKKGKIIQSIQVMKSPIKVKELDFGKTFFNGIQFTHPPVF